MQTVTVGDLKPEPVLWHNDSGRKPFDNERYTDSTVRYKVTYEHASCILNGVPIPCYCMLMNGTCFPCIYIIDSYYDRNLLIKQKQEIETSFGARVYMKSLRA